MAMVVAPEPPTAPVTPQQRDSTPPTGRAGAGAASASKAWIAAISCSGENGASRMSEASMRSTLRTRPAGRFWPNTRTGGAWRMADSDFTAAAIVWASQASASISTRS